MSYGEAEKENGGFLLGRVGGGGGDTQRPGVSHIRQCSLGPFPEASSCSNV